MTIKNTPEQSKKPKLIICFGVSGCGKSTLAEYLAEQFNLEYIEADNFHPEVNKQHMAEGKPLTDEMREPWINILCEYISNQASKGTSCVMANSGLRRKHRQRFRELGIETLFIHLHGSRDLIYQRMQARQNHYMPPELLDSQFEALESPEGESDVSPIDIAANIPEIAAQAKKITGDFLGSL